MILICIIITLFIQSGHIFLFTFDKQVLPSFIQYLYTYSVAYSGGGSAYWHNTGMTSVLVNMCLV